MRESRARMQPVKVLFVCMGNKYFTFKYQLPRSSL